MRMREYATDGCVDDEVVALAVEAFRMLADPTRVQLLWLLREGELSVSQLTEAVGKPQALVSQHLGKLRMARLVRTRREGNRVHYRIADDHVAQLVTDGLHHAEHLGFAVPAHHRRSVPHLSTESS